MSRATSSSSRSSRITARRVSEGVPRRCWCGDSIKTYVSKTDDNPFRRFYRCENAIQRKGEDHLFKWVDEAMQDEIKLLDGKHTRIVDDLNDLRKAMAENLKVTNDMVAKLKGEMKEKVEIKVKVELGMIMLGCYVLVTTQLRF